MLRCTVQLHVTSVSGFVTGYS